MIEVRPGGRRRIDRVLSPHYTDGVADRPLGDVRGLRDEAAQEETDLSYLRRLLHARIDIVRAEQRRRLDGGSSSVVDQLARILAENAVGPATGSGRYQTLEPSRAEAHRRHLEALVSDVDLSDVSVLTDADLADALHTYTVEEESVSGRRREVQDVVDRLNAEIARRYRTGSASVDELLAAERARSSHGSTGRHRSPDEPDDDPDETPSGDRPTEAPERDAPGSDTPDRDLQDRDIRNHGHEGSRH